MKVKSISDVITNSSTEVWVIREPLLEKARKELGELVREERFYGGKEENLWEKFKVFSTPEDLEGDWKSKYIVPRDILTLLSPFKLSAHDRSLLKSWGHTEEEISAREEERTEARRKELATIDLSPYLGKAVAIFGDHISRWGNCEEGKKLLEWLKGKDPGKENWWYDF